MSKSDYLRLSDELCKKISRNLLCGEESVRRNTDRDKSNLWRPCYIRDIEKIMHHPYYNRYSDKTQVFSFYKDDDITRRALHVQLVSRIARNIGRMLGLNLDLIEAIALGHDLGHTPFGHEGEELLNNSYHLFTGRYFNHNVQSVRVLDKIFNLNISLATLDGILCHNGELELEHYQPSTLSGFDEFDKKVEKCYTDRAGVKKLIPSTLEGCVVRVSDIIAYIGKDRQDAQRAGLDFHWDGNYNSYTINNFIVNIVENSYGKDYIKMDKQYYSLLKQAKKDNTTSIYKSDYVNVQYESCIKPMFSQVYNRLREDLLAEKKDSVIFRHHINYVNKRRGFYGVDDYLTENTPDDIVTDYIASMTDDYFTELCTFLFPDAPKVHYKGYFDSITKGICDNE